MKTKKSRSKKGAQSAARIARRVLRARSKTAKIPPMLFEGDEPGLPATGPGDHYALVPTPSAGPSIRDEVRELPAAYGTEKLLLVARDPHWLYAHWDLTQDQQRRYNALSVDRHLVVRVRPGTIAAHPFTEVHVHPESRSWFIHVERAGIRYGAELGYYAANRQWATVATSASAATPPDTVSRDQTQRFATIPMEVPLPQLSGPVEETRVAHLPPLDAAQERALDEVIKTHLRWQEDASSAGITDMIRGLVGWDIDLPPSALPLPFDSQIESLFSPLGGERPRPEDFWLNVNAELVLYGATESDASLTIGGWPIRLQPDGTFSFRFALPDGDHEVAVSAMSAEGDLRQARLKFSRRTEYSGEVGAAPQNSSLKAPDAGL